ncbi:MAG: thioredoxin domain-containing protein [Candidatus Colwellbacteria bacterium]
MDSTTLRSYGVPIAIVFVGILIAGALFLTGDKGIPPDTALETTDIQPNESFRLPSDTDHLRGDPDAPVAIIEFSDFECPFCAQIHHTLARIVEENSDVKWIYRHFPLSTIHPKAIAAAVASECIANLSGNEAFWLFVDEAFSNQRLLSDSWYRIQAESLGVNPGDFDSCMEDQSVVAGIQRDLDEAINSGGTGTPYIVVVTPSGEFIPFAGALPYEQIMSVIERARNS